MSRTPKKEGTEVDPGPRRLKIGCGHPRAKQLSDAHFVEAHGLTPEKGYPEIWWCPRCGAVRRGPHPNQWDLPTDKRNRIAHADEER
jgi:hypothetical protein